MQRAAYDFEEYSSEESDSEQKTSSQQSNGSQLPGNNKNEFTDERKEEYQVCVFIQWYVNEEFVS